MDWASSGLQEAFEHLSDYSEGSKSLFLPEFFLKDNEKNVLIQVVDKEPFNCYVHQISRISKKGNPYSVSKTCSHDNKCFYCEAESTGIKSVGASAWRSHLTVLDSRMWPYKKGDEDAEAANWTRRLWRCSAKRITPILKLRGIQRRGRLDHAFLLMTRVGKSMQTMYLGEYLTAKEVARDTSFKDVTSDLGWDPLVDKWAPCPEIDVVVPLDYRELLKPDTYEEAADFLAQSTSKKAEAEEEDDEGAEEYKRSVSRTATKKKRSTE